MICPASVYGWYQVNSVVEGYRQGAVVIRHRRKIHVLMNQNFHLTLQQKISIRFTMMQYAVESIYSIWNERKKYWYIKVCHPGYKNERKLYMYQYRNDRCRRGLCHKGQICDIKMTSQVISLFASSVKHVIFSITIILLANAISYSITTTLLHKI